jgi:hypothetical protein
LARGAHLLAALALALAAAAAPARAQAPTADETVARAQVLGVGDQAQRLREHFLPGVRLVRGPSTAPLGTTKLGGRPDLPRSVRWPACKGQRLAFLMQVRIGDMPGAGGSGMLAVFGGLKRDDDGVAPIELAAGRVKPGGCVAVVHVTGPLHRRATPRGVKTLRDTPVDLRPTLLPPWFDSAEYYLHAEVPFEPWGALFDETAWGVLGAKPPFEPIHQLLGWSASVQWGVEFGCGYHPGKRPSRRLLLELDWDERLRFAYGDGGVLFLTITPQDLRAGRYDRLCGEFQDS